MQTPSSDALAVYGWSERVDALYHSDPHAEAGGPARVTRVERSGCAVADWRGHERLVAHPDLVAVGDWVVVDEHRVRAVLERWSRLERRDPDTGAAQVLAANVDLVTVTVPADRANPARVERELTAAWDSGGRPVVVVTKADVARADLVDELTQRLAGVEVVITSARTGWGVDRLAELIAGATAVLIGPSAAGKSTLTNALLGEERQAAAEVRADHRGRHTTTARQLFTLPSGGVIIDTPGLRSLGLVSAKRIGSAFPDIDDLAGDCRFRDCRHDEESGCAVTAAVDSGQLPAERLASYHKLTREVAADRRRRDPLARQEALRRWKQRSKDAQRHEKRRPT